MLDAWTRGLWIAGLEVGEVGKLPPRLDDATWNAMSQADRTARTARLREIHRQNASIKGRSFAIINCLRSLTKCVTDRPSGIHIRRTSEAGCIRSARGGHTRKATTSVRH